MSCQGSNLKCDTRNDCKHTVLLQQYDILYKKKTRSLKQKGKVLLSYLLLCFYFVLQGPTQSNHLIPVEILLLHSQWVTSLQNCYFAEKTNKQTNKQEHKKSNIFNIHEVHFEFKINEDYVYLFHNKLKQYTTLSIFKTEKGKIPTLILIPIYCILER